MLYEIHRREANTEAGKLQLNYEKALVMMDAFGGMYFSMLRGLEYCRAALPVRTEIRWLDAEEE